jgi:hypothetical protein
MEKEIPSEAWEAGFLDRSTARRTFRRLTSDEVASGIA